jgi:hypothetical protein
VLGGSALSQLAEGTSDAYAYGLISVVFALTAAAWMLRARTT